MAGAISAVLDLDRQALVIAALVALMVAGFFVAVGAFVQLRRENRRHSRRRGRSG